MNHADPSASDGTGWDGTTPDPDALHVLADLVARCRTAQDVATARALLIEARGDVELMAQLAEAHRTRWNDLTRILGGLRDVRGLADDVRDFRRAIEREAERAEEAERTRKTVHDHAGRPVVSLTPDLHLVVRESVRALGTESSLYQRNGELVHAPGGNRLRQVGTQHMRVLLSRSAVYVTATRDGDVQQAPPWDVAAAVLEAGAWPGVRPIEAVVRTPVLRPDGSILQAPGYDAATRLVYQPDADYPAVPDRPTREAAQEAAQRLFGLVADFPFEAASDWTAWLAFVLTPFARFAIPGNVPLFLVEANTRGTGKSLLAKAGGMIAYGCVLSPLKPFKDEEELGKTITAYVREGKPYAFMDNVAGHFGWATLDIALTSDGVWEARLLGGNDTYSGRSWLVWIVSANNAIFAADTIRRTQRIRLRTDEEHPESRAEFRIPGLLEHIAARRASLVVDALTILRAFTASGATPDLLPWGSFERWSALVRGAIVWAGYEDPIGSHLALAATADGQAALLARLFETWPFSGAVTAADVRQRAASLDRGHEFREALHDLIPSRDGLPDGRAIGNKFASVRDRIAGGLVLRLDVDEDGKPRKRHQAALWVLCSTNPPAQ